MADFVAVLKKTIEGLGDSSPSAREKVYAKARATIDAKLAAIAPPPPSSVIDRQKKALEEAIRDVEAEFSRPAPIGNVEDDLDRIFASLDPLNMPASAPVAPVAQPRPAATQVPYAAEPPSQWQPAHLDDDDGLAEPGERIVAGGAAARSRAPAGRGMARLAMALVLLLVLAGGSYAVWTNRVEFQAMLGLAPSQTAAETTTPTDIVISGEEEEGTDQPEEEAAEAEAGEDVAALGPEDGAEPATPAEPAAADAPQKFTQRLTPDGREVDEGPAGGGTGVGEGTSVATAIIADQTQPPVQAPADAAAPSAETPPVAAAETPPAAAAETTGQTPPAETPAQPAIAVGQRAIFYEERTSSTQGSAETGSIVWSTVQESPGGDAPPEAAIRAEATIPGKDLQLRMTIRRNGDDTLPASHIVEMIFLTPTGFEGGGIENVLRMTMKSSEEAPGAPLLGIPAKIADGFFLVALTDGEAEIAQNTTLLQRDQWIDIPMVYKSGRRALITLEKGIPGGRVFDEAIKVWQAAGSG